MASDVDWRNPINTIRMSISKAEFVRGVIGSDPFLETARPAAAFVGRSNVGKSSVINSLVRRRDLVRSSANPGQTKQVNYFRIDGALYLADTPGYGYAKISIMEREKLMKLINWFLTSEEVELRTVVLVVDIKVGLKETDLALIETMRTALRPVVVVANKIDKLNQAETAACVKRIVEQAPETEVIPYSATKHTGRPALERVVFGGK